MGKGAIFLEKRSYRLRRAVDALRFLPMLGLLLWMVPLAWPVPQDGTGGVAMSSALLYLFGTWIALALIGFLLWHRTRRANPDGRAVDQDRAD